MTRRNNQTNSIIKWVVIAGDFLLLNLLLLLFRWMHPHMAAWNGVKADLFWMACNIAMVLAQWKFSTIIHLRIVSGGDILRRVFELTITQTLVAYIIMKTVEVRLPVGWLLLEIGVCETIILIFMRLAERNLVKRLRKLGRNTRTVTFVGSDSELVSVYDRLLRNPTLGYRFTGYYADDILTFPEKKPRIELTRTGSLYELLQGIKCNEKKEMGDELYVCLPRNSREALWTLSDYCDRHFIHFYYLPTADEKTGMMLRREFLEDIEVYTNHKNPLENTVNKVLKRCFDILMSLLVLLLCLPLFPVIVVAIMIQSPGPVFFRQKRTGINGKEFTCYKFRSMHVNVDSDRVQATEHDPRKYPFGNFMRKYNIDELPQFWNVLLGSMSVVGPRPHMLLHTEQYSKLIAKYMVRHFVKPGITGWAQVTGFRGETKELWQMEERVKRDIWYMEHWNFWLDIRIIWMTVKSIFVHDEKAY